MKSKAILLTGLVSLVASGQVFPPAGGSGGAAIPSTTHVIAGDGSGNGADSGIPPINVIVSTGNYTNPNWMSSLSWSKITGAPTVLPIGFGYTFYVSGGTTYARNNVTGVVDYSGSDAGVVIRSAIANNAGVCGHLIFQPGVYNINSLVQETATGWTNNYYGIAFPVTSATNQYCEWTIEGDSLTAIIDQFGTPVQIGGVILYMTPTAVSSVSASNFIVGVFARPNISTTVAASVVMKNVDVRFPDNQRSHEAAVWLSAALATDFDHVVADTNVAQSSLAAPVTDTYGLVTTASSHEENNMRRSFAIGYDTCIDIQSEHFVGDNSYGLNCNTAIAVGVRGGQINTPIVMQDMGCTSSKHCLVMGSNLASGTLIDISGFQLEEAASGTWAPTDRFTETNVGNSFGRISYTRSTEGVGLSALSNLFDGGGGTNFQKINGAATSASAGLGNVTNDTQTKAAIMPNTAPSAGQVPCGNAGGTAYAPCSVSGDATLGTGGTLTLASTGITAGSYTNVNVSVDAKGRITAIANGSGGSGTTVSAAPPYINIGGTKYVAATNFAYTAPFACTWLNSVSGSTTSGANGDQIVSSGATTSTMYWCSTTASSSVESEFSCLQTGGGSSSVGTALAVCGVWIWDSTNNKIYAFVFTGNDSGTSPQPVLRFTTWTYNGTGSPSGETSPVYFSTSLGITHLKLSVSAGTLSAMVSMNGGASYITVKTVGSIGTISKAGVNVFTWTSTALSSAMDVLSAVVN